MADPTDAGAEEGSAGTVADNGSEDLTGTGPGRALSGERVG